MSLIYVNIKPNKKTLHTFCFEGTPRTKINARDCIKEKEIYIADQYLQIDIYLWLKLTNQNQIQISIENKSKRRLPNVFASHTNQKQKLLTHEMQGKFCFHFEFIKFY